MHSLYFVIFDKASADSSKEARDHAESTLQTENFVGREGYFGGGKGDWFVVGGRWSGHLQSILLKKDFYKEAEKLINESKPKDKQDNFISTEDTKNNAEALQKLWVSIGGKNDNLYARDNYHANYDDDAMIITDKLINALKKTNKSVEIFDADEYNEKTVADLDKDDIGKWIVVIDYHM